MITIRRADESDAKKLSDLYRHFAERTSAYFLRCMQAGYPIFIARVGDADAGFAILNIDSRYLPFNRLNIPEIQDLNVIPSMRECGVASALIDACEDEARLRDHEDIGLAVGLNKSYGPAQRLYVKKGYMPDGSGAMYDHAAPDEKMNYPLDDDFCLMLVKAL